MVQFSNDEIEKMIKKFIKDPDDRFEPISFEYVDIKDKKVKVKIMASTDKWFGVTYKEDKPSVVANLQNYKDQGLYPFDLWK